MIEIVCDKCEKTLEIDDELAGERIECPSCGDVNRVPERGGGSGGRVSSAVGEGEDRAAAAGYPPDSGPEQRVMRLRPAMFRCRPLRSMGVFVGFVACLVGLGANLAGATWAPVWMAILSGVVLVLLVGVVWWWWMLSLCASLEVTNKRTIQRRGLLSKSKSEVVHDNIRNLQLDQTFWERIWGIGQIGISSSGQDGVEIQMSGLRGPEKIRQVIDLYRPLQ